MVQIEFLRQFRLFEYAIFDFVLVFVVMAALAPLLSKMFKRIAIAIPRKNWLFLALPLGIVTHLLVGKVTPMTRDFLDVNGYYPLKILILVLVILGVRGVKIISRK